MHDHATHRTPLRTGSAYGFVAACALVVGVVGATAALGPGAGGAATVASTADRIFPVNSNGLLFPIEPTPMCEFFNNFGGFSATYGSGGHQGVDIGAQEGQAVYAVERGVLFEQETDPNSTSGLAWRLHADTDVRYRYFHLSAFAPGLTVGDRVERGQLIGFVGDTGNATPDGWHLHFEVRPGPSYAPVDPAPLLAIPSVCDIYGTVTPAHPTTTTSSTSSTSSTTSTSP